jgi:hypothetical protein
MTIIILDRGPGAQPLYADWLADTAEDLVLITTRPAGEIRRAGYAEVRCVPDDATAELTVLAFARTTTVSALVATAAADLVRAGALRDHLGIAGQSRAAAAVFADPVATRDHLLAAGVPTIPVGAVERVSDLYWHRHQWGGGPLRVRRRKEPGWPTAAILWDDADLRAFTGNGLAPSLISVPSLFVEPFIDGDRHADTPPITHDTLAALPTTPGHPYRVDILNTSAGQWLVDTVESGTTAPAVRVQAGLPPFVEEVTRWAS